MGICTLWCFFALSGIDLLSKFPNNKNNYLGPCFRKIGRQSFRRSTHNGRDEFHAANWFVPEPAIQLLQVPGRKDHIDTGEGVVVYSEERTSGVQ
jgi:hypothetical protein